MTGSTKTEEDEANYTVATNDDLLAALTRLIAGINGVLKSMGRPPV